MWKRILLFPCMVLLIVPYFHILAKETIILSYIQRPPYYYVENGTPKGLILQPQIKILKRADIQYKLRSGVAYGILNRIRKNQEKICSIGWLKNKEREKFAKFTLPIYQNKPLVALTTAKSSSALRKHKTLKELLADKILRIGTKKGFSYGAYIDQLISTYKPPNIQIKARQTNLIKMLHAGRFSYLFMAPEEISTVIEKAGFNLKDFASVQYSDMPKGNKRYWICTKRVEDETIQKINQGIRELGKTDQQAGR